MTARLLLIFSLALSLRAECTEPKGRLGTTFACTAPLARTKSPVEAFLLERVRGSQVFQEKGRVEARSATETLAVWLTEQDGQTKLRVEYRPADAAPLLGESADAARALRSYLQRALQ